MVLRRYVILALGGDAVVEPRGVPPSGSQSSPCGIAEFWSAALVALTTIRLLKQPMRILQRNCRFAGRTGHDDRADLCPLSGVKRTLIRMPQCSS